MDKSDSITKLAAALAKAQPRIEGARKDKNNPAFRSKYADLSSVADAVASISEVGLSYVQVSHDRENAAAIETLILHESGEWMSCGVVSVPVSKHDAHGFGSALTYARRYSLGTAFGVVPEDDDGNAAVVAAPRAPTHEELASVSARLEEAARGGLNTLQTAWAAIPNEAKVALKDLKEKLKHTAADFDAQRKAA